MTIPNQPDVRAALIDAKRDVAIAKLTEFEWQCHRLGELVDQRLLDRGVAAETLYDIALANDLIARHGAGLIDAMLAPAARREPAQ